MCDYSVKMNLRAVFEPVNPKYPYCFFIFEPKSSPAKYMTICRSIFLMLLFVFAIGQSGFAQKKKVIEDDVYGTKATAGNDTVKVAEGPYYNIDKFVNGYIVFSNDEELGGMLRFNGTTVILRDTLSQKIKRYDARQIKGFVATVTDTVEADDSAAANGFTSGIHPNLKGHPTYFFARGPKGYLAADTFAVVTDTVEMQYRRFGFIDRSLVIEPFFAKLLIYGPKISLYKAFESFTMPNDMMYGGYRSTGSSYQTIAFYLKRGSDYQPVQVPKVKRDFKRMMVRVFNDDPALVEDINKEIYSYETIDKIVDRYNQDTNARQD